MQSKAKTVDQYLSELPSDRRMAIGAVRRVILDNLGAGYEEGMQYGMIGYYVPHSIYPAGYHCDPKKPLPFACLASQKNHMAIYMMSIYGSGAEEQWFRAAWAKTGRKLDMGKSCIRFRKLEDLALQLIGEAIRRVPVAKYITVYEANLARTRSEFNSRTAEATDLIRRKPKSSVASARSTSRTKPNSEAPLKTADASPEAAATKKAVKKKVTAKKKSSTSRAVAKKSIEKKRTAKKSR